MTAPEKESPQRRKEHKGGTKKNNEEERMDRSSLFFVFLFVPFASLW
jgi:hypothetical protein